MFTEVTLAPEIEDFLRGLTVPVRVLDGHAAKFAPPNWNGHARAAGASRRECEQEGITIVSWGSDHETNGLVYVRFLSGDAYNDGQMRNLSREFVGDQRHDERSYMPSVSGRDNATLARMDPGGRIVWFGFPLTSHDDGGLDLDGVDLYKILGEPIMRVLSADKLPRSTERARELFLESTARAQCGPVARIERQITDQRTQLAAYAEYIRQGYGTLRRLNSELDVQRRVTTVCQARVQERWDALIAHPKLTRIHDDGLTLVLTTVPLDLENPDTGETRYLGVIEIRLRHDDSSHGLTLRLKNLDNPQYGGGDQRAHPHCPQDQVPCWGGSEGLAGDLLASQDLPAILEFTLQYLGSYNPSDSWGAYASAWGFGDEDNYSEDEEGECTCSDCMAERELEREAS